MRLRFKIVTELAGAAFVLALGAASIGIASSATLDTIHTFCKQSGCLSGASPRAALLMADKRHFFGTASRGGANVHRGIGGLVYELTHKQDGSWKYNVIYDFCAKDGCADGDDPLSDLIVDKDGNLYGTTWAGGAFSQGGIFQLHKSASGWIETVIYNFSGGINNSKDGRNPAAGLTYVGQSSGAPWDEFSPLFGTTANGGKYAHGTAFRLVSDGSLWNLNIVHNFQNSAFPAGLAADSAGNLYGGTRDGAANNAGLFYKLAHDTWKQTVLHIFCSEPNCADSGGMISRPVIDGSGNVYGATIEGGAGVGGAVFQLQHGSSGYTYKVLYSFCAPCSAGETGEGLALDSTGDLYGTLQDGGANNSGSVFRLHNGANGWKGTVLYSFCSKPSCRDGGAPDAPPILDSQGNLFGITAAGGDATSKAGTVFELTP